jgi:hypothetical protein
LDVSIQISNNFVSLPPLLSTFTLHPKTFFDKLHKAIIIFLDLKVSGWGRPGF